MRIAIYARVSTEDQARTGYSLQSQVSECEKHSPAGTIEQFIDEGFSGEFLDRPAMTRLRDAIKEKRLDMVICYDPDRLARNLAHQLIITDEIERSGATLKFVSVSFENSPEGRLFYSIRGAVSSFEKEKIKERTNRGKKTKMLSGKMPNKYRTYGYDWDEEVSNYKTNEEQAKVIRLIYSLFIEEKMGTHKITEYLNLNLIPPAKGYIWNKYTVYTILTRTDYYGKHYGLKYKNTMTSINKRSKEKRPDDEIVEIDTPIIISYETFEKAQKQLQENKIHSKRNTKKIHLLQGVLYCGKCGGRMYITNKDDNYYYCCSSNLAYNHVKCGSRYVKVNYLDHVIWSNIKELADDRNKLILATTSKEETEDTEHQNDQEEKLSKQRTKVLSWLAKNLISDDEAEKQLLIIKEKLDSIKTKPKKKAQPVDVDKIIETIKNASTPEEMKKVIANTVKKVLVLRLDTSRGAGVKPELKVDIKFI